MLTKKSCGRIPKPGSRMNRRTITIAGALLLAFAVFLLAFLLWPNPAPVRESQDRETAMSTKAMIHIDFDCCSDAPLSITNTEIDLTALADTLNGVWVGEETESNGTRVKADYVMVFDMNNSAGLAYQNIGVANNRFEESFTEINGTFPLWSFLLCEGEGFPPAIHTFKKVSDNPQDGLEVLRTLLNIETEQQQTIVECWNSIVRSGFFERETNTIPTGGLFTNVSATKSDASVRIDWDAEYRGVEESSKKFQPGEAILKTAGGGFQVVNAQDGAYLVGTGNETWSFRDDPTSLADLQYSKVVLGPINSR